MATAPVKSPLHNFPLSFLKWGSSSVNASHPNPNRPSRNRSLHKSPNLPDSETAPPTAAAAEATDDHAHRQWNLRPRRSAPSEVGDFFTTESDTAPKSTRLRGPSAADATEWSEKRKLWVALSKEEIEDDFYALTGSKPSRRPRKRPRTVQKQVENLFPCQWLVGISPEAYRALDAPSKKQK